MTTEHENDKNLQQQPKKTKTSQPVPSLLQEIIIEILSRLPVESLLRCKSVCKLWKSLISDSHFIKSHLNLSINNVNYANHSLIYTTVPNVNLKRCNLYDVMVYDNPDKRDKPVDAIEVDYPMKEGRKSVWIVGSVNGLVCIAIEEDTLFIWNPSSRRENRLPPYCGHKPRAGCYVLYGFGYDEGNDDYKVVEISCLFKGRDKYDTVVKMYSLKFGNWKRVDDFPNGIPLDDSGKFVNGALHWAASKDFGSTYTWKIVSFDLSKESYGEVLQPVYDDGDRDLTLGALGGKLCVLCNYRGIRADLWVMKVYGVKDSWTKLVSIPYLTDPGRDQFSVPLCISNDGKALVQFGSKLVVFDSKNSSLLEIQNFDGCLEAYTFVESLVSPDAPNRPWR